MPDHKHEPSKPVYNARDIIISAVLFAFLILPYTYTNLTRHKIPIIPDAVFFILNTSGLFTQANYAWPMPYIQLQTEESSAWVTLKEEDYFKMPTFGYRTRLYEALFLAWGGEEQQQNVHRQLARWVADQYKGRHADIQVHAVRFAYAVHRSVPGQEIKGRWQQPSIDAFRPEELKVLYEYKVNDEI